MSEASEGQKGRGKRRKLAEDPRQRKLSQFFGFTRRANSSPAIAQAGRPRTERGTANDDKVSKDQTASESLRTTASAPAGTYDPSKTRSPLERKRRSKPRRRRADPTVRVREAILTEQQILARERFGSGYDNKRERLSYLDGYVRPEDVGTSAPIASERGFTSKSLPRNKCLTDLPLDIIPEEAGESSSPSSTAAAGGEQSQASATGWSAATPGDHARVQALRGNVLPSAKCSQPAGPAVDGATTTPGSGVFATPPALGTGVFATQESAGEDEFWEELSQGWQGTPEIAASSARRAMDQMAQRHGPSCAQAELTKALQSQGRAHGSPGTAANGARLDGLPPAADSYRGFSRKRLSGCTDAGAQRPLSADLQAVDHRPGAADARNGGGQSMQRASQAAQVGDRPAAGEQPGSRQDELSWESPDPARALELIRTLPLNPEQLAAATSNPQKAKMIRAGAGTGKTTTIVGKIIYMTLGEGIDPHDILGVTFTNKAARELKDRLAARGVRDVKVTTFHAFCFEVVRRYYQRVGYRAMPLIWSNKAELKAVVSEAMRWVSLLAAQQAIAEWLGLDVPAKLGAESWEVIRRTAEQKHPDIYRAAHDAAVKELEDEKKRVKKDAAEQQDAADRDQPAEEDRPSCAMSPKRRKWQVKRMERISQMELLTQLYRHLLKQFDRSLWQTFYSPEALAEAALQRQESTKPEKKSYTYNIPGEVPAKPEVRRVWEWIGRQKTRGRDTAEFAPHGDVSAWARYQTLLQEATAVDFDDLLLITRSLLRGHSDVRLGLQARYPFLLVDEYQDSNPLQVDIVDALQSEAGRVTVVGDDFQAIYGFRGSQPDVFHRFIQTYEHTDLNQPLQDNYRSRPAILAAGVAALQGNQRLIEKELRATKAATGEPVMLWETGHPKQEAREIVAKMKELHKGEGVPYEGMACLYRSMKPRYPPLEEELLAAGVPYNIVRGLALVNTAAVKDLLAYVRLVLNSNDDAAFLRIYNKPTRGLGETFVKDLMRFRENQQMRGLVGAECSYMECCRIMLARKVMGTRYVVSVRGFIDFIERAKLRSLQWTPSQTLLHLVVDSGLLEVIVKELEQKRKLAERQQGAKIVDRVDSDDDDPEEASEELTGLASPDRAEEEELTRRDPIFATELPSLLANLKNLALDFEKGYLETIDTDPATGQPACSGAVGTATLLRHAERAVVEGIDPRDAVEGLPEELLYQAHASFRKGPLPMHSFLEHISLSGDQEHIAAAKGVTVCTIHAAKGLEWDTVFVPQVNRGHIPGFCRFETGRQPRGRQRPYLPFGFDPLSVLKEWGVPVRQRPRREMSELERAVMEYYDEEARLLHVALTRGKERVFLSYIRYKLEKPGKQSRAGATPTVKPDAPSVFLGRLVQTTTPHVFAADAMEKAAVARTKTGAAGE